MATQHAPTPGHHRSARPPDQTRDPDLTRSIRKSFENLAVRSAPWLFDVGSWVFGGLIALNLVLVSAMFTVGPVDTAVLLSMSAFACALPLALAGVFLLRLIRDMKAAGFDDLALQAFKHAGFPEITAHLPPPHKRGPERRRRSIIILWYSLGIMILSVALTATGLVAALWHIAWWIGVVLAAAAVLSLVLVVVALAHSQPRE